MKMMKNIPLKGSAGKPMPTDIFYTESGRKKPVIMYAHGFNGFKDWGGFDLIACAIAAAGFVFIKFNFSHNGTTPDAPEAFADLAAYAENNYTRELDDIAAVTDWALSPQNPYAGEIAATEAALLGHSRSGGIVLLRAAEDARIKAVCTWASVAECKTPWGSWPEERMAAWKRSGVDYITNARTKQEMPLHYQLYEDFSTHKGRLDIEAAVKRLTIPLLICHGTSDTSVSVENAERLQAWKGDAQTCFVDSDHVFGRRHPWLHTEMPAATQKVLQDTIHFFRQALG